MEGKGEGRSYLLREEGLSELLQELRKTYKVIAPKLKDGVIYYSEVSDLKELPLGFRNVEMPGYYSLETTSGYFTYTHPVNSPKAFLHPPELTLIKVLNTEEGLRFEVEYPGESLCLFDVRACDLYALKVLDRVFVERNAHPDPYYLKLREKVFILAVNCSYATQTCFCTTMGTGPEVKGGYDLLLTELEIGFLIEVGSEKGEKVMESISNKERAEEKHFQEKKEAVKRAESYMRVFFEREGLPEKLYERMEAEHWKPIEKRCVACTSCTQVCPTCFCFDILEKNDLELSESRRVRVWDSCFSPAFATVHRFNLRQSIHSRYRQWLMHKFAYWTNQFGLFGCVGCGRCITWCPVGIDIRQEVKNIAEGV